MNQGILLTFLARVLVGGVLLLAGVIKLQDPVSFYFDLLGYGIFVDHFARGIAMTLPWLECFTGLCVLLGRPLYRGALLVSGLLWSAFLVVVAWAMITGLEIGCGCFGQWTPWETLWPTALMDTILLSLTIYLMVKVPSVRPETSAVE
ncbi:MAG: MauE/DoxX family redox-associated membrane protein [Verrucomicrobiales bacterium]